MNYILLVLTCLHLVTCYQWQDENTNGEIYWSEIYCRSELLEKMQLSEQFEDSKTFVDLPLLYDEASILKDYFKLPKDPKNSVLAKFLQDHFGAAGSELRKWTPTDFVESPSYLEDVADEEYRKFALDLNSKWKLLGRKLDDDVKENPHLYSSLYVPNGFVVPGGRFREFYYWDSYWVIQGLLVTGMTETVKGMLENFLYLVDKIGFIPNGGRVYYLNRSQPPLLIPMVYSYFEYTNDTAFLQKHIHLLKKEYHFWETNRTTELKLGDKSYHVNRYIVNNDYPRPESFREDYELGKASTTTDQEFANLMSNIASAAESGWDFSSRWYSSNGIDLSDTSTITKIPVDLNSFTCWSARILSDFYKLLGHQSESLHYQNEHERKVELIEAVFWDPDDKTWYDYDIDTQSRDRRFFASMIAPLFTSCHGITLTQKRQKESEFSKYAEKMFQEMEVYQAGIPTSLNKNSGQQWDYPNSWPPLQHMWIFGLHQTTNERLKPLAKQLATKWVRSNWMAWRPSKDMYEKYNALEGTGGSGGEYEVQLGFGWSNGVVIDILNTFPDISSEGNSFSESNLATTAIICSWTWTALSQCIALLSRII